MRYALDSARRRDAVVLLLLFALFLLASPFFDWWAKPSSPWYLPYLVWLGIIVLIFVTLRRRHGHDL